MMITERRYRPQLITPPKRRRGLRSSTRARRELVLAFAEQVHLPEQL
jgi:hypothetical protein